MVQHLGYGEDAVSVSFEEIAPATGPRRLQARHPRWPGTLYKKPGYGPS